MVAVLFLTPSFYYKLLLAHLMPVFSAFLLPSAGGSHRPGMLIHPGALPADPPGPATVRPLTSNPPSIPLL